MKRGSPTVKKCEKNSIIWWKKKFEKKRQSGNSAASQLRTGEIRATRNAKFRIKTKKT